MGIPLWSIHPATGLNKLSRSGRPVESLETPPTGKDRAKKSFNSLSMGELKYLAKKHGVAPKGRKVEGFLYDEVKFPNKRQ